MFQGNKLLDKLLIEQVWLYLQRQFQAGGVQPSRAPGLGPEDPESKVHLPEHFKIEPVRQPDAAKAVILIRPALRIGKRRPRRG
jgi:hypothetical protein